MSKITKEHIFTSESVSEGHPDKVCDQISDAVLDACLAQDSESRVACETAATTDFILNFGEIRCQGWDKIDPESIARQTVKGIGYDKKEYFFSYDTFKYQNLLHEQSSEIAMGVDKEDPSEQGAGDQGMMFGYATNETANFMPTPITLSHELLQHFSTLRRQGKISYLRPDAKAQVSINYVDGKPKSIHSIVISHQTDEVAIETIRKDLQAECESYLQNSSLLTDETVYYINPTGKFVIGGPHGDAGLTGRKIIVDTYGGIGSHGGGAFSGKDPSKVDRSAAYYARYVSKNIVAAGLAEKCEIQVSYAIGVAKPTSINIETYGTAKVAEKKIEDVLNHENIFDFRPGLIIENLQLKDNSNWKYQDTARYGHFGRDGFPWERLDKVEELKKLL